MYMNLSFKFTKLILFHIITGSTQIQMQSIYDVRQRPRPWPCLCVVTPSPSHLQEEDGTYCSGYRWGSSITSAWLSNLPGILLQMQDPWHRPGEWYCYVCNKNTSNSLFQERIAIYCLQVEVASSAEFHSDMELDQVNDLELPPLVN